MKKLILGMALLFLTFKVGIASPAETAPQVEIPVANLTLIYKCIPTQLIGPMFVEAGLNNMRIIGMSAIGVYQEWTGIQNGINVWILTVSADNGLTCRLNSGSVNIDEYTPNKIIPNKVIDEKLKEIK